jgi:hypothetical protein
MMQLTLKVTILAALDQLYSPRPAPHYQNIPSRLPPAARWLNFTAELFPERADALTTCSPSSVASATIFIPGSPAVRKRGALHTELRCGWGPQVMAQRDTVTRYGLSVAMWPHRHSAGNSGAIASRSQSINLSTPNSTL